MLMHQLLPVLLSFAHTVMVRTDSRRMAWWGAMHINATTLHVVIHAF